MRSGSTRRSTPRPRGRSRLRIVVMVLQVLILLGIGITAGVSLGMFVGLSKMLPNVVDFEAPEATIIYSSDDVVLGRAYREDRTIVELDEIPNSLINATIAIEDSRFYEHAGVDMRGIGRAVWANVRGHRLAQGGSTITQQLARNVYLTQRKTLHRKAQEALLAMMIERDFSKEKILELYLNQIYYGSGAFGVQAASKVYFGKSVDQLTLSEAALIAGLPRRPSGYSPHDNLEGALDRRDVVLNRMAQLGYITADQRDKAKADKIEISPLRKGRVNYKAPHFVDYVIRQLRERYGEDVVLRGGLRVYTTLNYEMQTAAEKALRESIKKNAKSHRVSEGCFVCVEPANGYIRAMVGSVDPKSEFNRCVQGKGRQPGSAFKLFVYTAALEAGMKPTDKVLDAAVAYPDGTGKTWRPKNYDNKYHGWVTLRTAVAQSINIPAIKIADNVGVQNVIKYAQLMGVESEIEPYLPLAIGGIKGIYPLEMAGAYATFANGGQYVRPMSVVKVTNSRGDVIDEPVPEGRRVVSEKTAKYMDEMLRAVVSGGTGTRARQTKDARGKTGTTNDDRDAWWCGYVPGKLAAVCWIGNDNYSPMRRAWGGLICAPIWSEFMSKAIPLFDKMYSDDNPQVVAEGTTVSTFKPDPVKIPKPSDKSESDETEIENRDPDTITLSICQDSGMLATEHCPNPHQETFVKGTEPTKKCPVHRPEKTSVSQPGGAKPVPVAEERTFVTVLICPESGMLASPNCPNPVRKRLLVDDVPTQVCTMQHRSAEKPR